MSDRRTLLITGASSGIGAATARAAAATGGWNVALLARSKDKLDALVEEIGADRALAISCDVTDERKLDRAVAAAKKQFGGIDAVFANAGTGGKPGGFSSAPPESWRKMIDINIFGLALTLRATLAELKARRGHAVITASVAGRRSIGGSMYSATKWAACAIGYNLREEVRGTGMRVTLIEPGMVDTPFFDEPKPDALRPEDIARAVVYAIEQPAGVDVHELMIMPTPPAE